MNTGIVFSGNGSSGTVADYNWYFPYVTTNILYNSILSQSRFGFHIWADSFGAVVPGLHYATTSTSLSGSLGANNEYIYFADKLYGTLYPQMHEFVSFKSSFSGFLTGTHYDSFSEKNVTSGRFSGFKYDTAYFSNAFSGDIRSSADPMYVNFVISGIINKVSHDAFSGQHLVSGKFWQTKDDLCEIGYSLIGYSISSGLSVVPITLNDVDDISFTLIGYQIN